MIDLIGDIHGHADKLEALLLKLGYIKRNGVYAHTNRNVLFVGDYIDRGPKIKETLEIVRAMVESENAIALMGNHEYNALCFHLHNKNGGHLREHNITNVLQHYETLRQFHNNQKEYENYLDWFKTLPLFYETDSFRAVHACWDKTHIECLKNNLEKNRLTDELIYKSTQKGTFFNDAIEETLKGKEIELPEGFSFADKQKTIRTKIRIKWWENPSEMTYNSISVEPLLNLPDNPIDISKSKKNYYDSDEKLAFFGHYWLNGSPKPYKNNICCLDYSVANGGKLVAYRFDGEEKLHESKIVFVD
jgi:hypothetical protein